MVQTLAISRILLVFSRGLDCALLLATVTRQDANDYDSRTTFEDSHYCPVAVALHLNEIHIHSLVSWPEVVC